MMLVGLVVLVEQYSAQRPGEAGSRPGPLTPLVGIGEQGVTGQPSPSETPVARDIIGTWVVSSDCGAPLRGRTWPWLSRARIENRERHCDVAHGRISDRAVSDAGGGAAGVERLATLALVFVWLMHDRRFVAVLILFFVVVLVVFSQDLEAASCCQ